MGLDCLPPSAAQEESEISLFMDEDSQRRHDKARMENLLRYRKMASYEDQLAGDVQLGLDPVYDIITNNVIVDHGNRFAIPSTSTTTGPCCSSCPPKDTQYHTMLSNEFPGHRSNICLYPTPKTAF